MCTGQHGTVAVSGEMYDEGMGDLMSHGGSIVCFIHRLMAGLSYRSQARGVRAIRIRDLDVEGA